MWNVIVVVEIKCNLETNDSQNKNDDLDEHVYQLDNCLILSLT